MTDIGLELAQLKKRLAAVERQARLSSASLDDSALLARDGAGGLRAIFGQQPDGTSGIQVVNGPPPPPPSAPIVASVLGGVTASWGGLFDAGAVMPLDWSRVEVHASPLPVYDPTPATLQSTIETAQGATVVVPCDSPVYVRLLARNTSGAASAASATVGPYGPTPVVASDLLDGIVTTVKIADNAVERAKVAVGAIGASQLALGVGNLAPDPSFEGPYTAALIASLADWTLVTPGNSSSMALHVDCTSGFTTWKNLELGRYPVLPGERHYLALDYKVSAAFDGTSAKVLFRYEDATSTITGYGVADQVPVPGGPWARATAQVQAPPNTVTAVLLVEASQVTAGEAWFDNVEVRTLIAGGMVAAGSITATEIAALTINAGNIAADAINASKIAAGAVTTAKLDALAVTADKIAANAITAGKILAGSVDATALAADAITGKTITGGTITGSVLRTAASGQRVAINESNSNSVKVYDATREVASMDAAGLKLTGTGGGTLVLDPNSAFPNLRLSSTDGTNSALVNVVANTPGSANLGLFSGIFTGSGYSDMRWRTFFGEDFWVAERLRNSSASTYIGGRVYLNDTTASIGYTDSTGTTQSADVVMTPGLAKTRAKVTIQPNVGDNNTVVFIQPGPSHTGYVMRYWDPDISNYRFTLDKAGNVNVGGMLTAGNIACGHSTITPSAANTPTSISVTGFNLTGTAFRAVATANTSAPGTNVTGVGCTNVTATSMTIWLTRTNTTATGIDWIVMSS